MSEASYHDDPDENVQRRAAETTNESPTSALPIQRMDDGAEGEDLERGEASSLVDAIRNSGSFGWGALSRLNVGSLRAFSASFGGESARRQAQEERDR